MAKIYKNLKQKNDKNENLYMIKDTNEELKRTTQEIVSIEQLQDKKKHLRARITEIDAKIKKLQGA